MHDHQIFAADGGDAVVLIFVHADAILGIKVGDQPLGSVSGIINVQYRVETGPTAQVVPSHGQWNRAYGKPIRGCGWFHDRIVNTLLGQRLPMGFQYLSSATFRPAFPYFEKLVDSFAKVRPHGGEESVCTKNKHATVP